MLPLDEVLAGRDERFALQRKWLSSGEGFFVCQIGLNVPGFPKRLPGDSAAVKNFRARLLSNTETRPVSEKYLENGAGVCWLGLFCGGPEAALVMKRKAVELENSEAGRIFDADVITQEGPVSRESLGLPPRGCFLCGGKAKDCARAGAHDPADLREEANRLVLLGAIEDGRL